MNLEAEGSLTTEIRSENDAIQKKEAVERKHTLPYTQLVLRKKWLCYFLVVVAFLTVGGVFFLGSVVSTAWHLVHGNSARFHQWDVPVPPRWWAFMGNGMLIVQHMRNSADSHSEIIFGDLPLSVGGTYDYEKQKKSLVQYMSKKGYQFLNESKVRLANEDSYCISFSDPHSTKRIHVTCDVPNYRLLISFAGGGGDAPVFYAVIQNVKRTN
jgi:hypothetical protein